MGSLTEHSEVSLALGASRRPIDLADELHLVGETDLWDGEYSSLLVLRHLKAIAEDRVIVHDLVNLVAVDDPCPLAVAQNSLL